MARFVALTLLAFCLATAAAQQQPRLRGHDRSLQEAAAAPAPADNKKAADAPQGDKQLFGGGDRVSDWPMPGRDYKAEGEGDKQISVFGDRESDWPRVNGNRAQEQQEQQLEGAKAAAPTEPEGVKQVSIFEPTSSDWPKPGEPARAKQQKEGAKAAEAAEGAKQISIFGDRESDWPRVSGNRAQEHKQPAEGAKQISIFGDRESDWPKPGEPTRAKQQEQQEGAKAAAAPEGKGDKLGILDALENPANGAKPGEPTS